MKDKKLSLGTKLGYGIGQIGDSGGYNLFYFFFLFFLTDVAGVSPAIAGTISLIAVLWDAITDPIIGHLSDNCKSKYGKRRPFMLAGAIPYFICMVLMFTNVDLPAGVKGIYFVILAAAFWTFYTVYVIPFFALGGAITDDFEGRTSLRAWASVFMYLAVMLASAAPPVIVDYTEKVFGGSVNDGWRNVGLIVGGITLACALICWFAMRGKEQIEEPKASVTEHKKNIFKTYWEILKLRPVKYLALSIIFWCIACAAINGAPVYLMDNNLHLSAGDQSLFFVLNSLFAIAWIPVINGLCKIIDKKWVYCFAMLFTAIAMCILGIIGINSFAGMIVLAILVQFGNTTFWTLYYSLMYDIDEVDEYANGIRREGAVTAIMALSQKIGSAIGLQIMGIYLELGGYGDPAADADKVANTILGINTWFIGVFGIIAAVSIVAYPVTKEKYNALLDALQKKKQGLEYSEEGFAEIYHRVKK